MEKRIERGDCVAVNGYPGRVVEVCSGQLKGMVVVRLASGCVCVDIATLR